MGILDDLLGNEQLQKQYKDFVKRYEQGDPSEGYSRRAQDLLGKLSPEERAEFLEMRQHAGPRREVTGNSSIRPEGPGKAAHKPGVLMRDCRTRVPMACNLEGALNPSRVDRTGLAPVCP